MFLPIFYVCATVVVAEAPLTKCDFVVAPIVKSESMCHSVMKLGQEALVREKQDKPSLTWSGKCLKVEQGSEV